MAIRNNLLGKGQLNNTLHTIGDFAGNTTKNTFHTYTTMRPRDGSSRLGAFATTTNQFIATNYKLLGDHQQMHQQNSSLNKM